MSKSPGWIWCGLLVFIACSATGDWSDCGTSCRCKWISGKKSANCTSAHLRKIPQLSSEIQNLDLHDNEINRLIKEAFASKGLLNLQKIILNSAQIKELHKDSFKDLRILVEVDLSHNYLTELPVNMFDGNDRLRFVTFSNNPLNNLFAYQFSILPYLKSLDFKNCSLKYIHAMAFYNLKALETIDLRHNLLKSLSAVSFSSTSIKAVFLLGNPWKCDCLLRDFKNWFLSSNLRNEELHCDSPHTLAAKSWLDVGDDQMGCAPELRTSAKILRPEPGCTLRFGCLIKGDPKPEVQWFYNGVNTSKLIFQNNTTFEEIDFIPNSSLDLEPDIKHYFWSNVTILNVTESSAGDWTCTAKNIAGDISDQISIVIPRIQIATARTAKALPTMMEIIGGAFGILGMFVFLGAIKFWRAHKRTNFPLSGSFADQEKKLLGASKVFKEHLNVNSMSEPEIEMKQPSPSLVEDERRIISFEPIHITIESNPGPAFPPPPPEFAIPTSNYGNIYISVQVAEFEPKRADKYPDLLGGATLSSRARASCEVNYDNMGPRVTATGSSVWSLPGSDSENPILKTGEPPPGLKSL